MNEPSDAHEVPDRFARRYHVLREIAAGGMASVHLARMDLGERHAKLVALKRMHVHLERDRSFRAMFLEEARVTSRIGHPNVCTVLDFGVDDEAPYIAMEYLSGETLARIIEAVRERPWAPEWPFRAAYLASQAAEGLNAAHELSDASGRPRGIVHGDVSPSNLLVTYGGAVKVLDFGIARPASERLTAPRVVRGKSAYLAPEHLAGGDVDRRADVWSLGVTLWEMLALEPLFGREDACSTIGAVASCAIPSPSTLKRRIPAALDAIVMRALERDPRARYDTARGLARDLVRFCRENVEVFDAVDTEAFMADLFPVERWRKRTMERDALAARDTSGLLRFGARADNPDRSRQAAS